MRHEDWLKTLKSDPGTFSAEPDSPKKTLWTELQKKAKAGNLVLVEGIYGDSNQHCSAYIEDTIRPETGGTFIKFFGCSYLYQGIVSRDITDRVAIMKRMLLEMPLFFLFPRKIESVYEADLIKWQLPDKEFSRAGRELLRVGLKLLPNYKKLIYCLVMVLEGDHAYFHRFRDAISTYFSFKKSIMKNKPWWMIGFKPSPSQEIRMMFKILISRENCGIISKFRKAKILASIALLIPRVRNLAQEFLEEINPEELKLDEADMYFNLNRRLYDFGGRSFEDRKAEFDRINLERKHILF